ncbi:MAG: hypothetical protein F4Z31_15845 [Gemmatimonadetes bacterium]|nr:hypothetical protein [Gemmatimonadota bacterium]MCY3677372.1 hypothetical protein [Gemmatimonadota bacterium]MYA43205.1 hypothetical protein [Gemmatimonadota bacterium]MYE92336.1 hypothetical protein [Gemmatimonadota bacterium]MYJ11088.1 hypothetical protein [Gemmatimonadota bacterium]
MKTKLLVWGRMELWLAGAVLVGQGSGHLGGGALGAQQPVALGEAEAVYDESFSVVSTVREMPDGRVLVADALGQVLVRLNLDAGTADTLGRVGEGPEEYRQPDAVWPLPGGKTLLVDLGNGRLTELGPELEFGDTRPYAIGEIGPGRELVLAIPQAVDDRGRLYFRSFGRMGGGELASDSAYILRLDLESEVVDSVGRIKLAGTTTRTSGGPNNQNTSVSPIPLSAADAWGVAADGRVVIVRSGDYHVDWISSGGDVVSGPAVAYEAVRIRRGKQEEWAHARSETGGGLGISLSVSNNAMVMTASRGGTSNDDDLDQYEWPDVAPAFYGRPVPVDPAGRAWVRRHLEAGEQPRYDVFDGVGEREMVVQLPPERRIVGFGDGKVYVVRMDEYGLQYLERYALP